MGNGNEQFMDLQLCAEYSKFLFYKLDPAIFYMCGMSNIINTILIGMPRLETDHGTHDGFHPAGVFLGALQQITPPVRVKQSFTLFAGSASATWLLVIGSQVSSLLC